MELAEGVGYGPFCHVLSTNSIRGWLPGPRTIELSLNLGRSVQPGRYDVAVGVVDPINEAPAVRLAITGRDAQGWYPVSHLEVIAAGRD